MIYISITIIFLVNIYTFFFFFFFFSDNYSQKKVLQKKEKSKKYWFLQQIRSYNHRGLTPDRAQKSLI